MSLVRRPSTTPINNSPSATLARPDPLDLMGEPELPTDLLPYLATFIEDRRSRNMDTYIACTGPEGWGKSSLGLTATLHLDPEHDAHDVIFDQDDYYRVYDPEQKDQTYVFDEAGRLLFNRNWNLRGQKALVQEVMENRKNRNVIFLHVPRMKVLDKYVREGRIALWFACTSQGHAMVRRLNYNSYTEEAYYPVVIQDHRWLPLETTHPEFAQVYYDRKDDAHTSSFHERKRRSQQKRAEEQATNDYKSARRKRILDKAD